MNSIGRNWIVEHPNLQDVQCVRYHPWQLISGVLEDRKYVHLVVTVHEFAKDGEVDVPEERYSMDEELPLQEMYHRESQVVATHFKVDSNIFRLP